MPAFLFLATVFRFTEKSVKSKQSVAKKAAKSLPVS